MSASPVRPRLHVHRGHVVAVAFWFAPSVLGERGVRGRVLAAWTPGTSVFSLAGGFLLRLPRPRPVDCETAPGLPLTLENGVFLSAPLSASERERLAPPPGSLVLVRAGHAEVFSAEPSRRIDVAAWLDVSGWNTVPVKGLGAPPPPVQVLESRREARAQPLQESPHRIPRPRRCGPAWKGARCLRRSSPRRRRRRAAPCGTGCARGCEARRGRPSPRSRSPPPTTGRPPRRGLSLGPARLASWLRRTLGAGGAGTGTKAALPSGTRSAAQAREVQRRGEALVAVAHARAAARGLLSPQLRVFTVLLGQGPR